MRSIFLISFIMTLLFCGKLHAQENENISSTQPFSVSGQIGIRTSIYSSAGIGPRRKPFSWYLTGAPVLKIYGVTVPVSFLMGESQRYYRQSFDQVSITPSYKWITVRFGTMNVTWSPLSMGGHTMFGAGIELTPARFRFGFLYGRLNRPVAEDTLSVEYQTPAFRRTGFASKVGYGTKSNYVDLLFLKAHDDIGSILYVPVKTEILPGENAVFGLASRQRIGKYFNWDADAAVSGYTRDLRSQTISLNAKDLNGLLKAILDVRTSTVYYLAMQSNLDFHLKSFKINLLYRRVDPDYKSMGAYYFQTGVENITLGTSLGLLKNRLRFEATLGQQHDNLLNKKSYTSNRMIGSGCVILNLKKYFGLTMSYYNYSSTQSRGIKTPTDSIRQSYSAQNFTITPRIMYSSLQLSHLLLLTYNRQWFNDHNKFTESYTQYNSNNLNGCYSLSFPKRSLTLSVICMIVSFSLDTNKTKISGFSLAGNMSFFKNSLQVKLTANNNNRRVNSVKVADIINVTLAGTWKINKHNAISATINYLKNKAKVIKYPTFSESLAELSYSYTF